MCYSTKRKIADGVKKLMRHKEIRKITIQDIMDETGMSRQSFYYHFQDIYDTIEWIGKYDFEKKLIFSEEKTMEEWLVCLVDIIHNEHDFLENIVNEMEWPKILQCVKPSMENQIIQIINQQNMVGVKQYTDEWKFCVDFFVTSVCYYLMDYVYKKRDLTNGLILEELNFLTSILSTSRQFMPVKRIEKKGIA